MKSLPSLLAGFGPLSSTESWSWGYARSVLTSVGCGWAGTHEEEGECIILTVTPPLFQWQNAQFLLECRPQPSMVSCIHSQRVLIMYQTIMSQCLASRMRRLPLPPLMRYSMQIEAQVWELDVVALRQAAPRLHKLHLQAFAVGGLWRSPQQKTVLLLEEIKKWDKTPKWDKKPCYWGLVPLRRPQTSVLSWGWRKGVNEITSASVIEFFPVFPPRLNGWRYLCSTSKGLWETVNSWRGQSVLCAP